MKYPTLTPIRTERRMTAVFGGYDHRPSTGEGEFYDMGNLSSSAYPMLAPREKRGIYTSPTAPTGLIAKDKLCYTDGSCFVIGDRRYDMGLDEREKRLVSMGAYVIIMPDKKYINTAEPEDRGSIEAEFTSSGETSFHLSTADGGELEGLSVSDTEPEKPVNMALWLDTSAKPHCLKQFSGLSGAWSQLSSTYIRINAEGIGRDFGVYDAVRISGVEPEALQALNGAALIEARGEDFIVVSGLCDELMTQQSPVTVRRVMPELDFITEANNRLWGCRYGTGTNGETVNEIYASKLGDFKNWECFMGIASDSYTASCGADGPFTGAVSHMGQPLFFRENCLHKVYGSFPSNFRIQTTPCRGVQRGCEKSLAIVNEVLFYRSPGGVCAYDGSLPMDVSVKLGQKRCMSAAAGAIDNKYYISMKGEKGSELFVYDVLRRLWHREDETDALCFATHGGELYYIDSGDGSIKTALGSGEEKEGDFRWFAETGELGLDSPDKKYISRLIVRLSMELGARISFFARYDSKGEWEHLHSMTGLRLGSVSVPIRPRRCDHLRLRIEGVGGARIYSIVRCIEKGGED